VSGDKRSEWTTKPCERDTLTILKRGTSQADPNFLSLSAVLFPAEEEPKAFYRLLAGPDFAEKQPFKTGQDASFLLSRIEFDRTGDELPFNHRERWPPPPGRRVHVLRPDCSLRGPVVHPAGSALDD
jgi:hypothetical protein